VCGIMFWFSEKKIEMAPPHGVGSFVEAFKTLGEAVMFFRPLLGFYKAINMLLLILLPLPHSCILYIQVVEYRLLNYNMFCQKQRTKLFMALDLLLSLKMLHPISYGARHSKRKE
jgi:hypothetical protein